MNSDALFINFGDFYENDAEGEWKNEKFGGAALSGHDDGGCASLSGEGRALGGCDSEIHGDRGDCRVGVGGVLHCCRECLYADQRVFSVGVIF